MVFTVSRVNGSKGSEVGDHPGEMRFAVVNEFHRAGRSEIGGRRTAAYAKLRRAKEVG